MTALFRRLRSALFPDRSARIADALERAIEHHEAGRAGEAERRYREILRIDPRHPDATHLLGVLAHQRGDQDEAIRLIESAIAMRGERALYHFNLGNAYAARGDAQPAAAAFERATTLEPGHVGASFNLGKAMAQLGRESDAVAAFRRVLELDPGMDAARDELARALVAFGDKSARAAAYDEGIALLEGRWQDSQDPLLSRLWLAHALEKRERWSEAAEHFRGVLEQDERSAPAHCGLGNCYNLMGRMADAVRHYREALYADPRDASTGSSLLSGLIYDPEATPEQIFEEHCRWGERFAAPLLPARLEFDNSRQPDRRLRLGYVSPDFRRHPVTAIFLPVLERHNPRTFETICYHNHAGADQVTERVRRAAHGWREIAAVPDDALAELIRSDGIDILVDLAGHTSRHRLLAFARRPAPVQVSWLGYFCTTGVAALDYFVSDPYSSPPGQERYFVERLLRLPATRFCYQPSEFAPEVNPLPANARGSITFGCFNNLAKIGPRVLSLWAAVLDAVPGSRLVIRGEALKDAANRERARREFEAAGLDANRVELRAYEPVERAAHAYHEIDVALDPFPFCGGMTSLDALWMGVPVVTLSGTMIAGRQTESMLANLGLRELVAGDPGQYVEIAAALAGDTARLSELRSSLRPRFCASPLADHAAFARALEDAYRGMWQSWIGGAGRAC